MRKKFWILSHLYRIAYTHRPIHTHSTHAYYMLFLLMLFYCREEEEEEEKKTTQTPSHATLRQVFTLTPNIRSHKIVQRIWCAIAVPMATVKTAHDYQTSICDTRTVLVAIKLPGIKVFVCCDICWACSSISQL